MPHLGGIEATRLIKSSHPEIKVLILTLHNRREYVDQARLAGAEGYLLKDEVDKELLSAIETLRQGGSGTSSASPAHGTAPPYLGAAMVAAKARVGPRSVRSLPYLAAGPWP